MPSAGAAGAAGAGFGGAVVGAGPLGLGSSPFLARSSAASFGGLFPLAIFPDLPTSLSFAPDSGLASVVEGFFAPSEESAAAPPPPGFSSRALFFSTPSLAEAGSAAFAALLLAPLSPSFLSDDVDDLGSVAAAEGVRDGAGSDRNAGAPPCPGDPEGRRAEGPALPVGVVLWIGEPEGRRVGGADIPAGAHRFRAGAGETGGGLACGIKPALGDFGGGGGIPGRGNRESPRVGNGGRGRGIVESLPEVLALSVGSTSTLVGSVAASSLPAAALGFPSFRASRFSSSAFGSLGFSPFAFSSFAEVLLTAAGGSIALSPLSHSKPPVDAPAASLAEPFLLPESKTLMFSFGWGIAALDSVAFDKAGSLAFASILDSFPLMESDFSSPADLSPGFA